MLLSKLKTMATVVVLIAVVGLGAFSCWIKGAEPPEARTSPRTDAKEGAGTKPADQDHARKTQDEKIIQGVWTLLSAKIDGKRLPIERGSVELVVTNEFWIWKEQGRDRASTYKLDSRTSPKQIDLTSLIKGAEGKTVSAIYLLDGDTLTVCESPRERPTKFSASAGSGHTLFSYRRADAAKETMTPPLLAPASTTDTRGEAVRQLKAARRLLEQGQLEEAAAVAQRVREMNPDRWGLFEDSPQKVLADVERLIKNRPDISPPKANQPEKNSDALDTTGAWANKLFDETTKDFGNCPAGQILKHRFKITNIYNVPLEIIHVRVLSSCVAYSDSPKTLQPRETAYLEVTMDTTRFSGAKSVSVHVTFGSEYQSTAILTVKANRTKSEDKPAKDGQDLNLLRRAITRVPPLDADTNAKNAGFSKPQEAAAAPDTLEVNTREMTLPVQVNPDQRALLKQLHLWVSTDQGKTWQLAVTITPDDKGFRYSAPKDGLYWFVLQTVSNDGKAEPSDLLAVTHPALKIRVQTVK